MAKMSKQELEWRSAHLFDDYEMRKLDEFPFAEFMPVNKITNEFCTCKMKWNTEGTRLACIYCNFEGT